MNASEGTSDLKNTVLLSGASGMLGQALSTSLLRDGFSILRLVRQTPQSPGQIQWNPNMRDGALDPARLEGLFAAIHLSGANVATRRWTAGYKREIAASRIQTTSSLAQVLAHLHRPPQVFASASAIGFYGNRGDEILDESSSAGSGFFPELCHAWEEAAEPATDAGIRVIHPRFGVVLGPKGGALDRLRTLFSLGLGGNLGNGRQWMSWIAEPDAVAAVVYALHNSAITGPFNVTAPNPTTNADFTRQLAELLHRPAFLTAPAFALRIAFGEMADEALLASTRAVPDALTKAGFVFQHPTLRSALQAILRA